MNNEIGRKITSLTLMTIMLAGGMTFAAPSMMPAAHAANANLFVSAEDSKFGNYMTGPQVIEVVVIDPNLNDTDEASAEPNVSVNGKDLRMVQGVDGAWYGYFADVDMAQIADQTVEGNTAGEGLDFGTFCDNNDTTVFGGSDDLSDTVGYALSNATGGVQGTATIEGGTSCTIGTAGTPDNQNVIREEEQETPALAGPPAVALGQIGLAPGAWPFIQLYDLNPTGNVEIVYNPAGDPQTVTLTFDEADGFAGISFDRMVFPQSAQIHATITDTWLDIDPTDEDSWTFGTNSTNSQVGTYYQVFNENGQSAGDQAASGVIAVDTSTLMCGDCALFINTNAQGAANPVLTLQDNGDSVLNNTNAGNTADANLASEFHLNNTLANPGGPAHGELGENSVPVTITEQGPSTGVFTTYDESDVSVLKITSNAARGTSATVDYNDSPTTILVGFDFATVDIQPADDEWSSGEEIPVVIVDGDQNKNSRVDEDLVLSNTDVTLIPALSTGDPFTLGESGFSTNSSSILHIGTVGSGGSGIGSGGFGDPLGALVVATGDNNVTNSVDVQKFSQRAIVTQKSITGTNLINGTIIDFNVSFDELDDTIRDNDNTGTGEFHGFNFLNLDVSSITSTGTVDVYLLNGTDILNGTGQIIDDNAIDGVLIANDVSPQSLTSLNGTVNDLIFTGERLSTDIMGLLIDYGDSGFPMDATDAIVADFVSFGFLNDGLGAGERIANQIVRIEAEETGDNTGTFAGSLEYFMINQIDILNEDIYAGLTTISDAPSFIAIEDLTDEDSPRVNYNDLGADGVTTQVADQQEAPSHSGIVSFDASSYKTADTVTVTLEDLDLNVDSDLIDIFTVVTFDDATIVDANEDAVGSADTTNGGTSITLSNGEELGRLLDVTFDDQRWTETNTCATATPLPSGIDAGLGDTDFTLIETGTETGIFTGTFQIPSKWCRSDATAPETPTGLDIEVNYVDFRDASGEVIEVGDGAGIRANTGSVSLDRTVYPVPFGVPGAYSSNTETSPNGRSLFPIHQTGMSDTVSAGLDSGEFLANSDLIIHVRVNDPDFNTSASGEDSIAQNTTDTNVGPVKISILRGASEVVLGYAGGDSILTGLIDVGDNDAKAARQFGPIGEITPDAGIFEIDIPVKYTDGPASDTCPATDIFTALDGTAGTAVSNRFDDSTASGFDDKYCILQGDILQVEYTDPADASGSDNTVTDSATFDLRNGVLQSDKSVYIIGSDMILTLIEPDLDLDNDQAETYDLDLIEWDSDAATITMGDAGGSGASFDPEPLNFRETGDSTGIFQIIIEIPAELSGDGLERGEEIVLEYTDWGPSGSDFVGNEDEDINLTIFTSNFGATVELDQKVYTWTDKVYLTIVAPDHNFDGNLVDEIGNTDTDPIAISTRGHSLDKYKLVETGTDTGIFTGEVILTGFAHDADGDISTGGTEGFDTNPRSIPATGGGPTDGFLEADEDDGISVSFEFSEDETIVGSALIRWNIGEVQWLEASYPATGTGVVRVIDPDMNLDPEAVDNLNIDVWSDSDAGGIDLTVTETNEATGIFEGTVFFTVTDESSGHRLRVSEGDTVTAEYEDNTLPDPYTTADDLDITATSLIGTIVPPLERAPATNLRTVDAFGNSLSTVSVDQQVQITADLMNGQDREQQFAYLVQIQDASGVTVSLAWITGTLTPGQSFSPALSWIPTSTGTYTATAFVWESVDNPVALSPPISTTITVS